MARLSGAPGDWRPCLQSASVAEGASAAAAERALVARAVRAVRGVPDPDPGAPSPRLRFVGLAPYFVQSVCLFHAMFGGAVRLAELEPTSHEVPRGTALSVVLAAAAGQTTAASLHPPLLAALAAAVAFEGSGMDGEGDWPDHAVYAAAQRRFAADWSAHEHDARACLDALAARLSAASPAGSLRAALAAPPPAAARTAGPMAGGQGHSPHPRSLALLFHGHYDRQGRGLWVDEATDGPWRKCSDYFAVHVRLRATLIEPLLAAGVPVRTYFHTYAHPSGCKAKDDALVAALRPVSHQFSTALLPRVSESYVRVLRLFLRLPPSGPDDGEGTLAPPPRGAEEAFILLRFDVLLREPLWQLPIDWRITSLAFRDKKWAWASQRKSSDLFF
ncbi:hypothetical protein T492DRAFT_1077519 [Pavlovales sp. CCMP2436]|nr:hypothetical protein T492DRAFT_1077519 [Pavlovales sp. CCMP2436]